MAPRERRTRKMFDPSGGHWGAETRPRPFLDGPCVGSSSIRSEIGAAPEKFENSPVRPRPRPPPSSLRPSCRFSPRTQGEGGAKVARAPSVYGRLFPPRRKNGNSRAREHGLACHRRRSFDLGSFCRRCWIFAFCPFSHRTNDAVSGGPLGAGACCMIIFGKQKKTGRPIPTTCWRKRGHD